ncbi:unnamed protein product, partial [Ectocarpus sp. 12 AP-2014]
MSAGEDAFSACEFALLCLGMFRNPGCVPALLLRVVPPTTPLLFLCLCVYRYAWHLSRRPLPYFGGSSAVASFYLLGAAAGLNGGKGLDGARGYPSPPAIEE